MKPYFSPFPTMFYDSFINKQELKFVTDIFKRSKATTAALSDRVVWYDYIISDGETPEILSYNYYNSVNYHWVILLTNQIQDPQWDWPMSTRVFNKYISKKYGSVEAAYQLTSHYETVEIIADQDESNASGSLYTIGDVILRGGDVVEQTFEYKIEGVRTWTDSDAREKITAHAKEEADNEARRKIVLLKPEYLSFFVEEFNSLIVKKR